ncbi:MAG: flagellar hook-length control protein FliK, partial [Pseudomonadota bacterium]|nr:flagellar hook-length control protein FliK [Pseudomonadota bacterium]
IEPANPDQLPHGAPATQAPDPAQTLSNPLGALPTDTLNPNSPTLTPSTTSSKSPLRVQQPAQKTALAAAESTNPGQPTPIAFATPLPPPVAPAPVPVPPIAAAAHATGQPGQLGTTATVASAPARTAMGASIQPRSDPEAVSSAKVSPASASIEALASTTDPAVTPPQPSTHTSAQPTVAPTAPHIASEPATAAQKAPDTPAAQLAQAVAEPVKVALAAAPQPGAPRILTIHLTPSDLGRVEIRIERPTNGPAKVELAVERPETLQRLLHDQPQLQQALDQAGIPAAGRTIQFSLSNENGSAPSPGNPTLSGDPGSNNGGQRSQQGYPGAQTRASDEFDLSITPATWARAGLDITA